MCEVNNEEKGVNNEEKGVNNEGKGVNNEEKGVNNKAPFRSHFGTMIRIFSCTQCVRYYWSQNRCGDCFWCRQDAFLAMCRDRLGVVAWSLILQYNPGSTAALHWTQEELLCMLE